MDQTTENPPVTLKVHFISHNLLQTLAKLSDQMLHNLIFYPLSIHFF